MALGDITPRQHVGKPGLPISERGPTGLLEHFQGGGDGRCLRHLGVPERRRQPEQGREGVCNALAGVCMYVCVCACASLCRSRPSFALGRRRLLTNAWCVLQNIYIICSTESVLYMYSTKQSMWMQQALFMYLYANSSIIVQSTCNVLCIAILQPSIINNIH